MYLFESVLWNRISYPFTDSPWAKGVLIRLFQIDSSFLVNRELKNLPASQEITFSGPEDP